MPRNIAARLRKRKKFGLGGVIGGLIGKAAGSLIPIPGVGTAIGSAAGSFLGNKVEGLFRGGGRRSADPSVAAVPATSAPCDVVTTQGSLGNVNMRGGGALLKDFRAKRLGMGDDALEFVGPRHELGGIDIPGFDAEVEGGETLDFFMKGGSLRKRDGEGEIPYVFSNTLKVPGSNLTFADQHKALLKKGGEVKEREVMKLAAQQEKLNGNAMGRNKDLGGFLSGVGDFAGKAGDYLGENVFTKENIQKAGEIGKTILPYLPSALAVRRGLQKPNVPTITPTRIDRSALRELERAPTTVDVSPQLARQSASYRSILANPNISSNAALAAHAQNLQGEAEILGDKRNRESQMLAQKALQRSNLSADFATREASAQDQANYYNLESQLGAEAARDEMLFGGLEGIANTFAGQQRDKQLRERDKQLMDLQPLALVSNLAHMTPELRRYYLNILKDYAPDKYKTVFERLSQDPNVPDVGTPGISNVPEGIPVPQLNMG